MGELGKERRKFPRITVELIVRYKLLTAAEQQVNAATKDISAGGVCLITREEIKVGTRVAMEIKFPRSPNPVLIQGQVMWSNKSRLGLSPAGHVQYNNGFEFTQMNDTDRQHLLDNIKLEQERIKIEGWKVGIVKDLHK